MMLCNRPYLFSFMVLALGLALVITTAKPGLADGLENTAPPEVLDIDDPFSRDLKRAAEDATGGIIFDDTGLGIQEEEETGQDLLGRASKAAIIANRYRVMGLAIAKRKDKNQIYVDTGTTLTTGSKPLMNYLRIGNHENIDEARQQAINLKSSYGQYLDASFIIRQGLKDERIDLDIGPFERIVHAERYCDMLISISYGLVGDCYVVQEYPGLEDADSFASSAIIRFSANAVDTVIEDTSVFDLPAASQQILRVKEGENIGVGATIATKVTPNGVIVVDEIGTIAMLPLNYIPEDKFEEKERQPVNIPTIPVAEGGEEPVEEERPPTIADQLIGED